MKQSLSKTLVLNLFLFLTSCLIFANCTSNNQEQKKQTLIVEKIPPKTILDRLPLEKVDSINKKIITVLLVPSSNGYDYAGKGFDLNPLLLKHLKSQENIKVLDFPYKAMKGSGYHGIFDKKYCSKIIEKVAVDYLLLSRMKGELSASKKRAGSWGYATKIVKTKNLRQEESIGARNLENFSDIEVHIKKNIAELRATMMSMND